MSEWGVVGVLISVIGLFIAVGTPIIKLNTTITRLITLVDKLTVDVSTLTEQNSKTHDNILTELGHQEERLENHESRITSLEKTSYR